MSRTLSLATAVAALALSLLAACGGSADEPQTSPDLAPEPTAARTPQSGAAISCAAIQDITSYRYTLRLKLDLPESPLPLTSPEAEALGGLAAILLGILSDIQIEGAFVAPDRSQAILHIQGQEVEVRSVGGQTWVRLGDVWREETVPGGEVFLSPHDLCEEIASDLVEALQTVSPTAETVNGLATRHYHLDEADLSRLAELVGEGQETLPQEFQVDVWLAEEGQWPVKLQLRATGEEGGQTASVEILLEFRDINNPNIEIEPPVVTGGQA